MTTAIRQATIVFVVVSIITILIPPWIHTVNVRGNLITKDAGYSFISQPPEVPITSTDPQQYTTRYERFEGIAVNMWTTSINMERLLLQLAGVLIFSVLVAVARKAE